MQFIICPRNVDIRIIQIYVVFKEIGKEKVNLWLSLRRTSSTVIHSHTDHKTLYYPHAHIYTHACSMQIDTVFGISLVCTKMHSPTVCSREIVNSFHGHSGIPYTWNTWNLENKKKDNAQKKFFLFLGEKETKTKKVINHIEWQNLPRISFFHCSGRKNKNILFFVYFSSVKVCLWLSYLSKTMHSSLSTVMQDFETFLIIILFSIRIEWRGERNDFPSFAL